MDDGVASGHGCSGMTKDDKNKDDDGGDKDMVTRHSGRAVPRAETKSSGRR